MKMRRMSMKRVLKKYFKFALWMDASLGKIWEVTTA